MSTVCVFRPKTMFTIHIYWLIIFSHKNSSQDKKGAGFAPNGGLTGLNYCHIKPHGAHLILKKMTLLIQSAEFHAKARDSQLSWS